MDGATMIQNIKLGLQKNNTNAYTFFADEQYYLYINKIVRRFVKDKKNEKNLNQIQTLIVDATYTIFPVQTTPVVDHTFTVPTLFWFFIFGTASVIHPKISGETVSQYENSKKIPISYIENEHLINFKKNPFAKTSKDKILMILKGDKFYLSLDAVSLLVAVKYKYIKSTATVSSGISCDLPEFTHDEIVDLTIAHMLEVVESQRYQTKTNEITQLK